MQIDGETMETVTDFIWRWGGASKIIADGDCSHEIKRHLLPGAGGGGGVAGAETMTTYTVY